MESTEFLSHEINTRTPGYGGQKGFTSKNVKSLDSGDSCNQKIWQINNHFGTHVDVPQHFFSEGKGITDYEASDWVFNEIFLTEVQVEKNALINPGKWTEAIPLQADCLLIQTGFERFRHEKRYWAENPGVSSELAIWLREKRPSLKILGLDLISIGGQDPSIKGEGKLAHQALLIQKGAPPYHFKSSPIRIIEDMKLASLTKAPDKMVVMPLPIEGADGSPVNILSFSKNGH